MAGIRDTDPTLDPVAALRRAPIPATSKGFGPLVGTGAGAGARSAEEIAALGVGIDAAALPLLTLRESALAHNVESMAAYLRDAGVLHAPHGKTTMAPQLVRRQLDAGAWGVTVATAAQARVFRAFGVARVLIANEVVDPVDIAWLSGELDREPDVEIVCYVDSPEGVALLDDHVRASGGRRGVDVVVELGHPGGRTGARGWDAALEVALAATEAPGVHLVGVAGYEGGLGHTGVAVDLDRVAAFVDDLRALAVDLVTRGLLGDAPIVSAGGSAFFDVVVDRLTMPWPEGIAPRIVIRSGAYISHDDGFYGGITPAERGVAGAPAFRAALGVWARVLSRPEPGLALLGVGKRDIAFDEGLPVPTEARAADGEARDIAGAEVTALNDQHAYLRIAPGSALRPGDRVRLGISHPCTTFDKWRELALVDDDDRIVDVIHTFF